MNRIHVLVALCALAGCKVDFNGRCETTEDCVDGAVCSEGICVSRECTPACTDWTSCVTGKCEAQFTALTIDSPAAAATVSNRFEVRASLTRGPATDGTPPEKARLLAVPQSGPVEEYELPLSAGTATYRAEVALKGTGVYSLTVKSDALALTSPVVQVTIPTPTCEPACTGNTYCVGTACVAAFSKLAIVTPGDGARVASPLQVKAELTRGAGATNEYPETVTASGSAQGVAAVDVPLIHQGNGIYLALFTATRSGNWTLVAKSDAVNLTSVPISVRVITCMPACSAGEVCIDAECLPSFTQIAINEPKPGAELDGAFVAKVLVTRRTESNEDFPASISLTATQGSAKVEVPLSHTTGGVYQGKVTPTSGGQWTLVAKSTLVAVQSDPVTVRITSCMTPCSPQQECDLGTCVSGFTKIEFVSPAANTAVGTKGIPVTARLTRRQNGTATWPTKLTLNATGPSTVSTDLNGNGDGTFTGTFIPTTSGDYTLQASGEGLVSPSLIVKADTTGPTLTLTIVTPVPTRATREQDPNPETAGTTAWRRDEEVELELSSTESVEASTVAITAAGPTGGSIPLTLSNCTGSPAAYCARTKVQLWASGLEMKTFRGKVVVSASAKDSLGNASSKSKEVPVTRWKWAMDPDPAVTVKQIKTAPAIGKTGTIYVGTSHGKAFAVNPDGTKAWEFTTAGPIDASIVVADVNNTETAFVAGVSAGKGAVWGITAANVGTATPLVSYGTKVSASPAFLNTVVSATPPLPTLVAVFNHSTSPRLYAIRIDETGAPDPQWVAVPKDSESNTGLAVYGSTAVFGDKQGDLQSYTLGAAGSWASTTGWPVSIGGGNRPTNPIISGSSVAGGANGVGVGRMFSVAKTGGSLLSQDRTSPVWNLVSTGTAFFAGSDDSNLLIANSNLGAPPTPIAVGGPVIGAPAIGKDGTVHLATQSQEVRALSSTGLPLWTVSLTTGFDSSPALDCSRNASGSAITGHPGVIYVGADDGRLYAFVTDSRGLDTSTSAWPKFHHDPGNTGNADQPIPACP